MRPHGWSGGNAAALGLLAASLLTCAAAAKREVSARLPDPTPPAPVRDTTVPVPPRAGGRDAARLDRLVLETVARNPFRPERARPAGRYRLPGSGPAAVPGAAALAGAAGVPTAPSPPSRPPLPQFRLVGTVALAGGKGIAALQVPGAAPRVVNVGDSISGFRLEAVSPTEATLKGADTVLVIRSSPPAP